MISATYTLTPTLSHGDCVAIGQRSQNRLFLSFRRKPEASTFRRFWTPACAGVTVEEHCDTTSEGEGVVGQAPSPPLVKGGKGGFLYENNERGFTLLEIIITFILAAFVGSMLIEYMGSSLTRGGDAVVMVQDGFSLNSVMEKITADYEDKYKNGAYDFSVFKSNIEGGNISTNTPYYGNYTVATGYISFPDGGGTETSPSDDNLLKVTITSGSQSLTTIFRK